jgi:hypothetical protein
MTSRLPFWSLETVSLLSLCLNLISSKLIEAIAYFLEILFGIAMPGHTFVFHHDIGLASRNCRFSPFSTNDLSSVGWSPRQGLLWYYCTYNEIHISVPSIFFGDDEFAKNSLVIFQSMFSNNSARYKYA